MKKPKLIVLNGFAAAGKTTIAQLYIAEHSLAFALEADIMVDNIGDWTNHNTEVRQLTFDLTKAMLRAYLPSGHDVVLPYLVTEAAEVKEFEAIAQECGADYYEVVLHNDRADAIARLLARGRWGEQTSPQLTEDDAPEIEELADRMERAHANRPHAFFLQLKDKSPQNTYQELLTIINGETAHDSTDK